MILVTGCTGYIGSRLCKQMLAYGYQIRGLIKPSERKKANDLIRLGLIPYYGDLTDLSSLNQISKDIHMICHLAGIHSTYSNTYNLYVHGTNNLIQAFHKNLKVPIIVISNSSVYANAEMPHSEGVKLKPDNPFGKITIGMENVIKNFCENYTIMRVGEVYGDYELDLFAGIRKNIVLIGNTMNYASKIHIDDLINILIICIDRLPQGIFNVCDNRPVKQIDFYRYAEKLSNMKFINIKLDIELNERVMLSVHGLKTLSISMTNKKIVDILNYKYVFPTYEEGLRHLHKNGEYLKAGVSL